MTKVLLTESYLDDIADAIREKRGVLTEYKPSQMAGAIMDIDTHDTHDATASAGDVLTGKTAYIATGKVSGTMPNQGAIAGTIDAENPSYTVPEGYHSGLGTVSADVATTAEVEAYVGRIKKLAPKTITENGTYDAEDDNVGGYSQVTVNVPGSGSTILSGMDAPSSSQGNNGDIYLRLSTLLQGFVNSESELSVTVTASTNWSGYEPWKAFKSNTAWIGNGGNPHWLQIETPGEVTLGGDINFKSFDSNRAKAISRIGYSDDGVNFTEAVLSESTMSNNVGHAVLSQNITGRYFRLYFDGDYGSSAYPMVGALELYTASGTTISSTYLKVSGAWQDLIGSDVTDVGGVST